MLVNPYVILKDAKDNNYGVGSFNVLNIELAKAVIEAAENLNQDVMLQITDSALSWIGLDYFLPGLIEVAKKSKIKIAIHYDHVYDIEHFQKNVIQGFTSGMYDGSKLAFDENVNNSLIARNLTTSKNIFLELEIGVIGGKEDSKISQEDLANEEQIIKFYELTKPDALAAAFGTAHGVYKNEVKINFDLIKNLNQKLDTFLVLHGSSGLSEQLIKKSIASGISKVNVGTDLLIVYNKAIKEYFRNYPNEYDIRKINQYAIDLVKEEVTKYLMWFK
ncbi:hypothetical protein CJJ23_00290 [Mycoplasmopsis agassizii]|uniref:Fructose-bisphosphate aldolase n=1 Tax=Mycoplasmopsis agassizii TaxID=33922 RepID=A0A269TKU5_9BACT|nr:class II fructose-bisphosphate aldolase [Mycoplasmopsis agassizii]PAK21770.1 hypothetical protein CJJ23_00290 [Mycoplasmopsis agassizii]